MKSIHKTGNQIHQVNIPYQKPSAHTKRKNGRRAERRYTVRCQHNLLFTMAVYKRTGKYTGNNIRNIVKERHKRNRHCRSILLICPQNQCKTRHSTAKLGQCLAKPKYNIIFQTVIHWFIPLLSGCQTVASDIVQFFR